MKFDKRIILLNLHIFFLVASQSYPITIEDLRDNMKKLAKAIRSANSKRIEDYLYDPFDSPNARTAVVKIKNCLDSLDLPSSKKWLS